MINNYKGISLMALVIAIIVLLILAGITINLTVGSNGIFTKAQTAKEQTNMAQAKENVELKIASLQTETEGKATIASLKEYAKTDSDITIDTNSKIIYKNEYEFTIDNNLKITNFAKYDNKDVSPASIKKISTPMVFDTFDRNQ